MDSGQPTLTALGSDVAATLNATRSAAVGVPPAAIGSRFRGSQTAEQQQATKKEPARQAAASTANSPTEPPPAAGPPR